MKFLVSPETRNFYSDRSRGRILVDHMENSEVIVDAGTIQKGELVKVSLPQFTQPLLDYFKENQISFILDLTDYKFHKEGYRKLYIEGAGNAIAVTTTCRYLANICEKLFNRKVYVIQDPTERQEKLPVLRNIEYHDPIKIVWYGIRDNMKGINFNDIKKNLEQLHPHIEIKIITNKKESDPFDWIQWSHDMQEKVVAESDIVLIPTPSDNDNIRSKGNNRPIDAIRQGKFVITGTNIPSYHELKDFMYVGDIQEGLKFFLMNQKKVGKMISNGQEYIRMHYTPEAIAQKWQDLENNLINIGF